MAISLVAVLIASIGKTIQPDYNLSEEYTSLCHTLYFLLPATVNLIVNLTFIVIGVKISKAIREFNNQQISLI